MIFCLNIFFSFGSSSVNVLAFTLTLKITRKKYLCRFAVRSVDLLTRNEFCD